MNFNLGTLFLVSTPIGNLGDITYRAISTLKNVNLVAVEDTRHSKKLFKKYNIATKMVSYFEQNRFYRIPFLIRHLLRGKDLALISDAGTPGISDPGYRLIREAILNSINIEVIPGASALLAGLALSGLPTDRFIFEGFLPLKKGRMKRIKAIKGETATIIYYESPNRLIKTLCQLFEILGERPCVVAREITKLHEDVHRGTLSSVITFYQKKKPKGECVILIGKDNKNVFF